MSIVFHTSRKDLVRDIAREAFDAGELNLMAYAQSIQELYFKLIPPSRRNTKLRQPREDAEGEFYEADRRNNRQLIERWVKRGVAEFPDDMEEPWVLALPEKWRAKALTALSARYGLLPAHILPSGPASAWTSDVLDRTADLLRKFAPIADDGVIDYRDVASLPGFIEAAALLMGVIASLRTKSVEALMDAEQRGSQ